MATQGAKLEKKSFDHPDEARTFDHGKIDVAHVGEVTFGRIVFEPGWRWSTSVKPLVGTESCQVHHVGYVVSGHLKTEMDDGTVIEAGPGDLVDIPPGHDGWVVGDEPAVFIDVSGAEEYAKRS